MMDYSIEPRVTGLLLGTAAGDSLGLPGEHLGRKRWLRRFPGPLRQRFLFGHGMISDDTEHTIMAAQAVLSSGGDPESFLLSFSWRLRYWLLFLPSGCGWGTLRSVIRLWSGLSPRESGVASAGNGAAMRSAVFGVL
ncbi:MAG: ADP-ribosylglycohydrolase family protein, partial [Lentisphaeria bacterium]|nr:ADP-ribosylglycohydrolase family protein [Lentisphaeria bacterium]